MGWEHQERKAPTNQLALGPQFSATDHREASCFLNSFALGGPLTFSISLPAFPSHSELTPPGKITLSRASGLNSA